VTPDIDERRSGVTSSTVVVAGVTAIVIVTLATIVGLSIAAPSDATPLITTVMAFVAPTIVALLALAKADQTHEKVATLSRNVNGRMDELVEERVSHALLQQAVEHGLVTQEGPPTR
jgi:hypothetical protein